MRAFHDGRYNVLCNAMLLTEGYDEPSVDCIVILRPTKSRALYAQMVGRGTRLCDGKEELLLLDFLWQTGRHNLCRPASLVAADGEVERRMAAAAAARRDYDLMDLETEVERDMAEEAKARLASQLAANRHRRGRYVDPLDWAAMLGDAELASYAPTMPYEAKAPTDKQLYWLEKLGISTGAVYCRGQAAMLLDRLFSRDRSGLSTLKQMRYLDSLGFVGVEGWTKAQASDTIDLVRRNGWKVPEGMDLSSYVPE